MSKTSLPESFFRHQFASLVAQLSHRFGLANLALVEDSVQSALTKALEQWQLGGQPDNPSGWLYRVACNVLLGQLRQTSNHQRIHQQYPIDTERKDEAAETPPANAGSDEALLTMLFICCSSEIPLQSQLVFALKTLCGFDVREIALRLFITEANVHKRLQRARKGLQHISPEFALPSAIEQRERLPVVHKIIYVLFTEGYQSCHNSVAIRNQLCDEAIRLATVLVERPAGRDPNTCALLALMCLHSARQVARQDAHGGLTLLEDQDRRLWDARLIQAGMGWLEKSARGETFSRFHAEAAIAAEHCRAPSFADTRWDRIVECYELLERTTPSPIHQLNRAVAVAEWKGPEAALEIVQTARPPTWLAGSYLWAAVLADLHQRCGNATEAMSYAEQACSLAPTAALSSLLKKRLAL